MTANEYEVSQKADENVLKLTVGNGCITLNILKITGLYTFTG